MQQIERMMPRLLALFDTDHTAATYGMGDRSYWAWKLMDFGNGTFQGAAHGLARLLSSGLLPANLSENATLRRIDALFHGARHLARQNGSLEEAFPYESSFCVTALVAFDLLTAVELLADRIARDERNRWIDTVRRLISFLSRSDEYHAVISNHLATAAAALLKWTQLTGEPGYDRGRVILARLLNEQSGEGWFREYEGADPGYQTLCLYYLADIHVRHPELLLLEPLRRSMRFLWHFAHPDGSFGGHYGSRNTRFYYPAGIEALARELPEAACLAAAMRWSIAEQRTVVLETMDEPNLVPMFNAYCWSASLIQEQKTRAPLTDVPVLPCRDKDVWRKQFPGAGLVIDKGVGHYTVVSWHKGGVCYHYSVRDNLYRIDTGVVIRSGRGKLFSTQAYERNNELTEYGDRLVVTSRFTAMRRLLPGPLQFALLRLLSMTLLRIPSAALWIKAALVRLLITGKRTVPVRNRRTIDLGPALVIADEVEKGDGYERVEVSHPFSAIHMASQGYWQRQDEDL